MNVEIGTEAPIFFRHFVFALRNSVGGTLLLQCPFCYFYPCCCWYSILPLFLQLLLLPIADLTAVTNLSPVFNLPGGVASLLNLFSGCGGFSCCCFVLAIADVPEVAMAFCC